MKRYIHIEDVRNEILKTEDFIISFEEEIENSRRRIVCLNALLDYLEEDGLCPFASKELLNNNLKLQEYTMPLVAKQKIQERQMFNNYNKDNEELDINVARCMNVICSFFIIC